jgi:uncharacterized protein
MARPRCCSKITGRPLCAFYAPGGAPAPPEDIVSLALGEFEALRLSDFEGLYQAEAAGRMRISRPTFGRILESAHRKIAGALIKAKPLRIEDGAVGPLSVLCDLCPRRSNAGAGDSRNAGCPRCREQSERKFPLTTPSARRGGTKRATVRREGRI